MHKAAQAYLQTQVTTTSQGELLLLLYDGAIKFLTQAKERMAARDMAGKGVLISKALDVINELDSSLNAEKGGELADNLHKLYFYCSTRLLSANLKLDPNLIDEVIKVLSGLRGAYAQIVNTPEAQAAAADVAARQSPTSAMPQRGAPVMPGLPRPPAGFAARAQANAAYGQTTPQAPAAAGVAFERPVMPPPAHVAPSAVQEATRPAPQTGAPAAPGGPAAHGQTPPPAAAHGTLPFASPGGQTTTAPAPPAAPSAPSKQAAPTGQADHTGHTVPDGQGIPGGFANKRLAASNLYRKLSQG
ncbi:flagellar export chaperone FliS [Nitratidesulfovibrio vulgaris]|uniref:Flagellar protein FliS n=1 Tax=Nitratidesulfovibrio vulgaris (strain DP4) TaxID=391774 RepID=A0A0H3A9Y9_NITV4|nr:flagellar export chaperone FliS [Nitratidesulfovibrio vulgaris]ABM29136.1 flagellar protein FliS [Nitratidesulfovibrio vulgaris DP4]GEB81307.1 flagellar protein FliS [Desulfovibrio desulfuricans]